MQIQSDFRILTIKNFSFIFLICIIITPLILFDKTKSQETKIVELIGNELAAQEDERVIFMISDELSGMSANYNLESAIKDKDRLPNLGFYLWKESKFSNENYNSGIIILDTGLIVRSDFNINPANLNTDSIISFVKRKYFDVEPDINPPDASKDTTLTGDTSLFDDRQTIDGKEGGVYLTSFFDNVDLLRNSEGKYYVGIVPIENSELRNTKFAKTLGYILIAVHSESKNLVPNTPLQLFRNYSTDNLIDKLISKPVITEFQNGDVINSTDLEVSKNLMKSLEPFRTHLKTTGGRTYWRYETINNEKYRTFYILTPPVDFSNYSDINNLNTEKIYSISLKRDDFAITMIYYFKFILFTVTVFIVIYILLSIPLLFRIRRIRMNFKEKLFTSFLIVSVIPVIFLAVYTRSYITNKNNNSFQNQITSDLSLVNESLKDTRSLLSKTKTADSLKKVSGEILKKNFSGTDKNFNFFVKNKLIASTNDELYKSDLLDSRVDAEAYYSLVYQKKDVFIKNQDIGGYSFLVGYKPFKSLDNLISGFLSSMSVYKQQEINEELTDTLTFVLGSYVIVSIILLIIVSVLTSRISKPLLELKKATDRLSLGDSNVEIKISRNDEFGSLVDSFNNMIRELEKSKTALKRAEREAAWRDIARRVAHEIKNPLTPMKLSIQHLYTLYKEKRTENFEAVLQKTKDLIVNEIDKLNKIATEFSSFAKLPRRNYELLDINGILEDVVSLYSLDPKVSFVKNLQMDIRPVYGDKQELNRAFQNIIKNAVQAILENGSIEVKSYSDNDFVFVTVTDDGSGIEPEILDKLCEPNFSTKSQGMGLGLAITKKTLDDMKADIKFTSKLGMGTKVLVTFIAMKDDKSI